MTDTLLKSYIHSIDLSEDIRDQLEFSDPDKIRMYSDERVGVRLKPTKYNRFAEKVEFPVHEIRDWEEVNTQREGVDFDFFLHPAWNPDEERLYLIAIKSTAVGEPEASLTWVWEDNNYTLLDSNGPLAGRGHAYYDDVANEIRIIWSSFFTQELKISRWTGTSWEDLFWTSGPSNRQEFYAAYDSSRKRLVLFGGNYTIGGTTFFDETWEFYNNSWEQKLPANKPPAGSLSRMAYSPTFNYCLLFSGRGTSDHNQTWTWDGTNWTQQTPATNPSFRYDNPISFDLNRNVFVMYGGKTTGPFTDETWEYNGADWTLASPPRKPLPISSFTCYYPPNKTTYLPGGYNFVLRPFAWNFQKDPMEYDGYSWVNFHDEPGKRQQYSFAQDTNRNVSVMYGGANELSSTFYTDTWEFNGEIWKEKVTPNKPNATIWTTAAFDSNRNVVVLYGGATPGFTILDETWEFDGTDWTQASPTATPGGLAFHSMTFDSNRNVVVLFGGQDPSFTNQNNTWEYNGTTWTQITTASSPSPRESATIDFDSDRNVSVLYGGSESASPFRLFDTWEYDGVDWTQTTSTEIIPPSSSPTMFYNPDRKRMVFLAGLKANIDTGFQFYPVEETYEYDGTTWTLTESETPDRIYIVTIADPVKKVGRFFSGRTFQAGSLPSGPKIYPDPTTYEIPFEDVNNNITVRLPEWSPQAVKGWIGFEEVSRKPTGTAIFWRVSDGTNDYWFNGSSWVAPANDDSWNTEIEISANINTFPYIQKKIQFIAKLRTSDRWVTPVLLGIKILVSASFDWFEDVVIRSLVPRIEEDFTFLMDWAGSLESTTDRFNVKTDYPFTPEEDLNIVGIEAVYNDDTDPNYTTDLLQSFDANTGEAILTSSLPSGTRLFYRLNISPNVAINFTNTDYDEIGKTPTVIIDRVDFNARQVKAVADIALKDRDEGRKLDQPLWVERMRFQCAIITGKLVNVFRLMTQAYSFVVRGATQQTDHKIGPIIKTKALDLEHTIKIIPTSQYNPKPNFSDLKELTFEVVICDFYAWLRDIEQTKLVTSFNTTVEDMRKVGTGNPNDEIQQLPSGVILPLYRTPETEEV